MYVKPPTTPVHTGATAILRAGDDLQYEAELGVVVEKWRAVAPAAAMDHVAGFICVNDITNYAIPDAELCSLRAQGIDDSTPLESIVAPPDNVPAGDGHCRRRRSHSTGGTAHVDVGYSGTRTAVGVVDATPSYGQGLWATRACGRAVPHVQ